VMSSECHVRLWHILRAVHFGWPGRRTRRAGQAGAAGGSVPAAPSPGAAGRLRRDNLSDCDLIRGPTPGLRRFKGHDCYLAPYFCANRFRLHRRYGPGRLLVRRPGRPRRQPGAGGPVRQHPRSGRRGGLRRRHRPRFRYRNVICLGRCIAWYLARQGTWSRQVPATQGTKPGKEPCRASQPTVGAGGTVDCVPEVHHGFS
jgi:hypothetical protein